MNLMRIGVVTLVMAAALGPGTAAVSQDASVCLGNNNAYTVPVGAQYVDTQGLWTCAPNDSGATLGGWVLSAATPSTSTPLPPQTTTADDPPSLPVNSRERTFHLQRAAVAVGVGAGSLPVMALLFIWRRRQAGSLTGTLNIKEVRRGGS